MSDRIPLSVATGYTNWWLNFLLPHATRLEVAGSIRRSKLTVGDIDIVCVPAFRKRERRSEDLFTSDQIEQVNCAYEAILAIAEQKGFSWKGRSATTPPPKPDCKYMWLVTPKCELDLWFATEGNWVTRYLCRTGSMEHNIWIAQRAERLGLKWKPYDGLFSERGEGSLIYTPTEAAFYEALDMDYVEPERREHEYLQQRYP